MDKTITNKVIKDKVTFVKTAEDTDGEVTELEITLQPEGKNELHYHTTYSETFTAVDGDLGLQHSKTKITVLKPGETYTVKKNEPHAFFNPNDHEITFKVELRPGHSGFEKSLRILYGLSNDGLVNDKAMPKNIHHLAVIAKLSDMRSPNLMLRMLSPLFTYLGNRAARNGLQKELVERYCS